ncbi:MAG: type II secretion system GspH family protein [Chitinispirillales bacterium]|jgi:prepilin-type N-terminal cleavage/methylation domain-containing protein|nr:type II secretion system GspH family protein [Chitinispirillales bacterium]
MRCRRAALGVSTKQFRQNNRAGFTLIELVVAITVCGVISAAAIVNWSSFIQYQEMRRAAHNLHKELLALKASALSDNIEYEIVLKSKSYDVKRQNDDGDFVPVNSVSLQNNVTFDIPASESIGGDSPDDPSIAIKPNSVNAFDMDDITIRNGGSSKRAFRIKKDPEEINPYLEYTQDGTSWKRM